MKTIVYIDGFNFYYGCLKKTQYKWLDYGAFCRAAMPSDDVTRIRYFTARIKADGDEDAPVRQSVYLRALETVPNLEIHEGRYFKIFKKGKLIEPRLPDVDIATIRTWEEKSSDVCLATHLVADGFRGDYEQAVVISNDSDLVEPISLIRTELNLPIHVLSPHGSSSKPSFHLQQVASSYSVIDRSLLAFCQFPESLPDREGRRISKPEAW